MMGVVIKILPSLLKNIVIKKHKLLIYQKSARPDPFARTAKLIAAHLKTPILSNTIDITIVDIMVMLAPLTMEAIWYTPVRGTIPKARKIIAPRVVGIDSLIPNGLQIINNVTVTKTIEITAVVISNMILHLTRAGR
ncbi:hypothetical protein D3C85_1120010 [compost metagenome]